MQKIVCVVGPTASGKTKLGIALCKALDGEVVSADSMQIYRGMDIGTAKPSMAEREGVRHHLFDLVPPDENYSVSRFVAAADAAIADIAARGKLPIVVGGTGLYIDALRRGGGFAAFDADYRAALMQKSPEELFAMLREQDPESAARLHINDKKRVCRALEIVHATGKTIGAHDAETRAAPPRYDACMLGLTTSDRAILYARIEARIDTMLQNGLMDEIRALQRAGVPQEATAMQAIGYKELFRAARGEEPLEPAVARLKQATRRLAKRQLTWFRRDPEIHWLTLDRAEDFAHVLQASRSFVKNCGV